MNTTELNETIQSAKNLTDLHNVILAGVAQMDEQDRKNLDLSGLPTFGGAEPADTYGVWSWDANSLLVGDGAVNEWRIVSRQEWADRP